MATIPLRVVKKWLLSHPCARPVPELGWPRSADFLGGFGGAGNCGRDGATVPPMNNLVCQLCVQAMVGWVNRGQQQVIDYLVEENRVLREQLGGRRLRLTDKQRRRLAVRAEALGRKALMGLACIVTPDTLLLPGSGVIRGGCSFHTRRDRVIRRSRLVPLA